MTPRLGTFKASQGWTVVEILEDPYVRFANGKYLAATEVEILDSGERMLWYIAASSAARPLEELRLANGTLVGMRVRVRKEGSDQFSTYEIEPVGSADAQGRRSAAD
jgi:hypothetical protein